MPRIDLTVPFAEKDEAKRLGARWDATRKIWYIPDGTRPDLFQRWIPAPQLINLRSSRYFILRTKRSCWQCKTPTAVFAFRLPESHQTFEADEDNDGDNAHESGAWVTADLAILPHYIKYLSGSVRQHINALTSRFYLDFSKTTESHYWMNHCEYCGAKQGDFELFCEPDVAFMAISAECAAAIQILEIHEPFEAQADSFLYDPQFL